MSKIIINNNSELNEIEALGFVSQVIKEGRVSKDGKRYCYATFFKIRGCEYCITSDSIDGVDIFYLNNTKLRVK